VSVVKKAARTDKNPDQCRLSSRYSSAGLENSAGLYQQFESNKSLSRISLMMLCVVIPEPGHKIPESGKLSLASNVMQSLQVIQV
jgi:hypothetical protein